MIILAWLVSLHKEGKTGTQFQKLLSEPRWQVKEDGILQ
jgi:hypothetical protein